MGANFNAMHVRVAAAIQDTVTGGTTAISASSQDGQKRSSAQRSKDIMAARYWMWSLYRSINKAVFFGEKTLAFVGSGGVGYADITALGITSVSDLTLIDTSGYYNKPIPVFKGDELQIYQELLQTTKRYDIVAGLVADNSQTSTQLFRLKLLIGSARSQQDTAQYSIKAGYYVNPLLVELTSASSEDLTEPRAWWDAMERYAEYLGWKLSGNTDRAGLAKDQAYETAIFMVSTEYGEDAAERVRKHLSRS